MHHGDLLPDLICRMSWVPCNWQDQHAKRWTSAKLQVELAVQSGSKCSTALTRLQSEDALSPPFLNQLKAAFSKLAQNMTEEVTPHTNSLVTPPDESGEKLTSYKGILRRRETGWLESLEWDMQVKQKSTGIQNLMFPRTTPPLKSATNTVKLTCSSPFIYFTFI